MGLYKRELGKEFETGLACDHVHFHRFFLTPLYYYLQRNHTTNMIFSPTSITRQKFGFSERRGLVSEQLPDQVGVEACLAYPQQLSLTWLN
jgi:hypothetical protein